MPCPIGHSTTPLQPKPAPETSRCKVADCSHRSTTPYMACMYKEYTFRYIGTLRVVTARDLVVLSGSFTSHSTSVRRHRHLRGLSSHETYTVSNAEGQVGERNPNKPVPQRALKPPVAGVRGAHAIRTTALFAPF